MNKALNFFKKEKTDQNNSFKCIEPYFIKVEYDEIYYNIKNEIEKDNFYYLPIENSENHISYSSENILFFEGYFRDNISQHFKSIVKEEDFFTYLELNKYYQNKEEIIGFSKNALVSDFLKSIDIFKSRLNFFNYSKNQFYNKYSPFENMNDENRFIAKNIIKELTLCYINTGHLKFEIKDNYETIILNYFKEVICFIRRNEDLYDSELIKKEINRIKLIMLEHNMIFLNYYKDQLEEIIMDFNNKLILQNLTHTVKNKIKTNNIEECILGYLNEHFKSTNANDIKNLLNFKVSCINEISTIYSMKKIDIGRILFQLKNLKYFSIDQLEIIYQKKIFKQNNKTILDKNDFSDHKRKLTNLKTLYTKDGINIPNILKEHNS